MPPKDSFFGARMGVVITFLFALLLSGTQASGLTQVVFTNSIRPVAAALAPGVSPAHPHISRNILKASELAAPMEFEVALKLRNFAELQARVAKGELIPLPEMAAKYDPLPADYQATLDWLTSSGLTITQRDSHHMLIFASGTVNQIQQALQVKFARVTSEGKEYTSAVTAPSVPASLSSLLVGINGLQPHLHAHKHIIRPEASGGNTSYSPAQIAQAYQATGLYNEGIIGTGQTIAIVIDTFPNKSDLIAFWNSYGINQSINNVTFVQAVAGTLPPTTGEETLDTEWSSAMAPGAKIRVYAATSLDNQLLDETYQAVYNDATSSSNFGIHQMSMSFGQGENETTGDQMTEDDALFAKLAAAGVTCFASSGDNGSTPGEDESGDENETGALQPETPASDPNVTGVGGTTLQLDSNNNESSEVVWNEAGIDGNLPGASGGGTSTFWGRPTWQHGNGIATVSNPKRLVPDIACAADPGFGADFYYTDPVEGLEEVIGGTSWSSPTCAGFCALLNEARANLGQQPIGLLGPDIYPLIGTSNFRDIVSGGNDTPLSDEEYGSVYQATTGYDEATGIGVPLMQTLAQTLAQNQTLLGVSLQLPFVSVNQGQNAVFTATATGSPTSYQWQRMPIGSTTWSSSSLSNTSVYSGSTTPTLTVMNTTTAMSGDQFQCVVTYAGVGTVTSAQPSTLIVETPWIISTLAGDAGSAGLVNNPGTSAQFDYPTGIAIDTSGNLYVTDLDNNVIRKITPAGVVSTPYGSLSGQSGDINANGNAALFSAPRDITIDSSNNLYVSDEGNNAIREINTTSGAVTTIGSSASPAFIEPKGIVVDSSGNVYVADYGNNAIRKIATNGTVTFFAGSTTGVAGYNNAQGTQALFNGPLGLAIDSSKNLYVADFNNEVIRKITSAGAVTTLAGQPGVAGCLDGTSTQALFNVPRGVMADSLGNLYVTDSYTPIVTQSTPTFTGNDLFRKISSTGVVTTLAGQPEVAGTQNATSSGAQFYNSAGLAMNSSGEIYIADASNNTIRTAIPTPTISVSAPIPNASIVGPAAGQFLVSRTGSTSSSVTVTYSVAGTAVANTDYYPLTGTVTIPVGASTATITVNPLPDANATTSLTVQVTLTGSPITSALNPSPATVTIAAQTFSQQMTFAQWENTNGVSGETGDTPQDDGVPNLLKYLCDVASTQPLTAAQRMYLPTVGIDKTTTPGTEYLTLTYRAYADMTGVTVTLETSTDLQTWTPVSPPNISQQVGTVSGDPIIELGVIYNGSPHQFIRLNVSDPSAP
jgi:kumamolisin